jgi:hypothetical protein
MYVTVRAPHPPEEGRYHHEEKLPFGATVQLPDPVDITLETERLKEFAD